MSAGVIYMKLHELSINGIGGFGRNKKTLKICFFIGSCAIMGVPGFNGFISKNLLHHALTEAVHLYGGFWLYVGEIIFVISSAFTTAYLLKLFVAVFVERSDHDIENIKMKVTGRALIPMTILASMIVFIGVFPDFVMNILHKTVETFNIHETLDFNFYSFENIKSSFKSIFIGVLIYVFFIRRKLKKGSGENWWYENIALNWFSVEKDLYIPLFKFLFKISSFILRICDDGLLKLIILLNEGFNYLINMPLKYRKNSNLITENMKVFDEENDYRLNISYDKTTDLVKETKNARYKMNSITYSIYIFGVVLVVFMILLLY
jgi:NADH:ubiquinone oxidoreductase subunit 5 (subunit L)/multisubunit Na+/H+ antiporter MnhA subunit